LAPEDLCANEYVAVLGCRAEYPSFFWWGDSPGLVPDEPVRIEWSYLSENIPLRIEAICLPFVFVKSPKGKYQTLDICQHRLARLDHRFAKAAWRRLKQSAAS
jgi:hypothetical protein